MNSNRSVDSHTFRQVPVTFTLVSPLIMRERQFLVDSITEYNAVELKRAFDLEPYVYIGKFIPKPEVN